MEIKMRPDLLNSYMIQEKILPCDLERRIWDMGGKVSHLTIRNFLKGKGVSIETLAIIAQFLSFKLNRKVMIEEFYTIKEADKK